MFSATSTLHYNELARIFPEIGVDVEDVLSAAATKWNFHRYTPGVGVGGHCIPSTRTT